MARPPHPIPLPPNQGRGTLGMGSRFLSPILMTVVLAAAPGAAAAEYPVKAIRIVVTYAPGGSTDVVARLLGQYLGEILGQQIVRDNRGGAGGSVGTNTAARAGADGYPLPIGTSAGLSINPLLHRKLP